MSVTAPTRAVLANNSFLMLAPSLFDRILWSQHHDDGARIVRTPPAASQDRDDKIQSKLATQAPERWAGRVSETLWPNGHRGIVRKSPLDSANYVGKFSRRLSWFGPAGQTPR